MAMEIVPTGSSAQNQALSSLLNALKGGQPLQVRVQSVTLRPSGDAQVRINVAGQGLDVKVDPGTAAQLKVGGQVTLQQTQTAQGPQLTLTQTPANATGQGDIVEQPRATLPEATRVTGKTTPNASPGASTSAKPDSGVTSLPRVDGFVSSKSGMPNSVPTYGDRASTAASPTTSAQGTSPLPEPLAALQREAMVQQRSMADLFANLQAMLQQIDKGQRPQVSQDLETAMRWVMGFQLQPKQQPGPQQGGDALKQIMMSLGLLGQMPTGQTGGDATGNLKAALSLLLALLPDDVSNPTGEKGGINRDRPPLPEARLQGQSQRAASILPTDPNGMALARLRSDVEAALARSTLSQLATLSTSQGEGSRTGSHPLQTLHTEIPVSLPSGTAVIQMTVEQGVLWPEEEEEHENDKKGKREKGWTVSFAIDAEPVGAIDASIMLKEQMVRVSLATEREETLVLFEEGIPVLEAMLEEEGLTLDQLVLTNRESPDTSRMIETSAFLQAKLDRSL
ncbi:flagellar hook-length control protein FliK [uncultured Cohaesibacter sp.]|uniref:flagellar hook-length control protein FliK n=1 Tax=uncultured Cohaesibacter sp. TaxID=1002546 RepID=UPI0029C76F9A|nr:flagellar hook-length control protein FliK [uncultured Cohaesibacter sp.]